MVSTYTVDVFYQQLENVYRDFGPGGRWLDAVVFDMFSAAKANVPRRSSELANSHRIFRQGVNQYKATISIEVGAEYAEWVHEGTSGASAKKGWLWLPPGGPGLNTVSPYAGSSFPKKRLKRVAGQNANPWLDDACQAVANTYGAF